MPSHNCIIITMFSFQGTFLNLQETQWNNWIPSFASVNLFKMWWRLAGSNRWPPACKAGALPAELNPHIRRNQIHTLRICLAFKPNALLWLCFSSPHQSRFACFAGVPRVFLKWWAKMDSNHRPHDYQSCALASWAIGPYWTSFTSSLGTSFPVPSKLNNVKLLYTLYWP